MAGFHEGTSRVGYLPRVGLFRSPLFTLCCSSAIMLRVPNLQSCEPDELPSLRYSAPSTQNISWAAQFLCHLAKSLAYGRHSFGDNFGMKAVVLLGPYQTSFVPRLFLTSIGQKNEYCLSNPVDQILPPFKIQFKETHLPISVLSYRHCLILNF